MPCRWRRFGPSHRTRSRPSPTPPGGQPTTSPSTTASLQAEAEQARRSGAPPEPRPASVGTGTRAGSASATRQRLEHFLDRCSGIAAVAEVAAAFGWREVAEDLANPGPEFFHRAFFSVMEARFQLGERFFDRVEIRAVRRAVDDFRSPPLNRLTDARHLVGAQVIQDHSITWLQRRCQRPLHIGFKPAAVEWTLQHERRSEPFDAYGGQKSGRLPVAVRGCPGQSLPRGHPP